MHTSAQEWQCFPAIMSNYKFGAVMHPSGELADFSPALCQILSLAVCLHGGGCVKVSRGVFRELQVSSSRQ